MTRSKLSKVIKVIGGELKDKASSNLNLQDVNSEYQSAVSIEKKYLAEKVSAGSSRR